MGADQPPPADGPPAGPGKSTGGLDAGPQTDEATPETDAAALGSEHPPAADSPGTEEAQGAHPIETASGLVGDEAHALGELTPDYLVRTDVNTEAEPVLRGEVDLEALVTPPRDEQGHFADKPGQVHAEGLADVPKDHPWNDPDTPLGRAAATVDAPLSVSPADEASMAQGDLTHYPGADQWANGMAREGDRVWFASHEPPPDKGGPEGQERLAGKSGFGVPEGELHDGWQEVALSAARYNEGAQVEPHLGDYRGYLDCYEFTRDTPVATGTAAENTRHGHGGMAQMYIPNARQLIADGKVLTYVETAQFEGPTTASDRVRRQ